MSWNQSSLHKSLVISSENLPFPSFPKKGKLREFRRRFIQIPNSFFRRLETAIS